MALAIDTRAANAALIGTGTTSTSFTVTATSPLFVAVVWQSGTITSVKWNTSETFTQLANVADGITVNLVTIYGLKNPTTGTHNIDVVSSGTGGGEIFIISTTGGDTATGWRSIFTRHDPDGTGPGLTVTDSVSGDIVFHGVIVFATSITWDGGETTTTTTADNIAGNTISGGMSTKAAVGASTVVGATDQTNYAEIAFAVIPASAGITAAQEAGIWAAMQSSGVIGRVDA